MKKKAQRIKKPAMKNRPLERPSLINLNHSSKIYKESHSENDDVEEIEREKNMKKNEIVDGSNKRGKWAEQKIKRPKNDHKVPRNQEKLKSSCDQGNDSFQPGKEHFIGDSAATSHMTSNNMGVYNLTPIKGSVMIGHGQSIICTHKGKLDVICKHKDVSMAKETWDVKIVPKLNHDHFSFTKVMKEGWQMNGRWKEGGLIIELFKTTRASMKYDRMIPSGSSWLMGAKVQRVVDQAHAVIELGKMISMWKFHQITGHTAEHLLKPTAKYMKIEITGSCHHVRSEHKQQSDK